MPNGVEELEHEVLDDLNLIRDYLEANPPKEKAWAAVGPSGPKSEENKSRVGGDYRPIPVGAEPNDPKRQDSRPPRPSDPSLARLKDLLSVLGWVFVYKKETVANVSTLARFAKDAVGIANELGVVYRFDSIQLPKVQILISR